MNIKTFVLELLVTCLGGFICGSLVDVWIYIFQRISREFRERQDKDYRRQPLIPRGTKTHVFTDIPDDDMLTSREGHPYT